MNTHPTAAEILAAADRVQDHLDGWDHYLGQTAGASTLIAPGPNADDPDLMRDDVAIVLAAARAAAATAAHLLATAGTACTATGESVFDNQPPLTCALPAEPAHTWHRSPNGAKWSDQAAAPIAHWTPAPETVTIPTARHAGTGQDAA